MRKKNVICSFYADLFGGNTTFASFGTDETKITQKLLDDFSAFFPCIKTHHNISIQSRDVKENGFVEIYDTWHNPETWGKR